MATFVQIEPDAFNSVFASAALEQSRDLIVDSEGKNQRAELFHHVRRPVRGIQVKDDTYATVQVRQSNGMAIPLFDAGSPTDTGKGIRNSNFLIQSVTEQRAEKQQIILTFGEPYLFLFGEQPRMITVSGILLNTEDFNWRAEWWENYDRYLRGTQCVRMKARAYLSWDDIIVEGYFLQANAAEDHTNRNLVQFSFQMFLTNYQNISNIGDIDGHWSGKEINLNPDAIDLPGSVDVSMTSLVRQANVQEAQLNAGVGSNSLIDALRNGLGSTATKIVELQGQAVDFLSLAGRFVSGRNIRVPVGFEGAAAFDQEVQLAVASIPGAADVLRGTSTNTSSRTLAFSTGANLVPTLRASLGSRFGKARVGEHLSANEDEYVARVAQDDNGETKFNFSLASLQRVDTDAAVNKVNDVFEEFGIQTDPPSELTLFFRKAMFGIVSVAAGLNLENSSSLRSALTSIGTVL